MPRKTKIKCKKCGSIFNSSNKINIIRTWHMISPIPDKNGNLTITIMASWTCPNCGSKNTGKISTIKSNLDAHGETPSQKLINIIKQRKIISISELADIIKTKEDNIKKALEHMIKKKIINAVIKKDVVEML